MLNQYYKFLSNRLIQWLDNRETLKAGDKYFVLLDDIAEATNFYHSLSKSNYPNKTKFESSEFDYETFSYKKDDVNVLFVAPINGITQDFLVTVRNRVNANNAEWQNTAVFFIVFDALDSIIGGSFDVTQQDGPFSISKIKSEVIKDISNNQSLSLGQKKALDLYVKDVTNNSNTVLKDYETLFSILEKSSIDDEDFNNMGFFPDRSLDTIPENVMDKRLESNKSMFQKVERLHDHIDLEERLNEEFSGDVIKKLSQIEDWKVTEYREVEKGIQEKNKDKEITLNFDFDKFNMCNQSAWYRLEGDKGAKSKKAHLIMSSANHEMDSFSFDIFFDDIVNKSSIIDSNTFVFETHGVKHDDIEVIAKGKKINITIHRFDRQKSYGGLLKYKHKNINKLTFSVKFMIIPPSLNTIHKLRPNFKVDILKGEKKYYFGISSDVKVYKFGLSTEEVVKVNKLQDLKVLDVMDKEIIFEDTIYEEESNGSLFATTYLEGSFFPIAFQDITEKPVPVLPLSIERTRLGLSDSQLVYEDNKIFNGSNVLLVEKMYKNRLNIEMTMLNNCSLYGEVTHETYYPKELDLPEKVVNTYKELIAYYKAEETTPSLAVFNDKYISLLQKVLLSVEESLDSSLVEGEKTATDVQNIKYIGMVVEGDSIGLTPLSPFMIAYQIEEYQQLSETTEVPKEPIIATLNPQYLMPYIKINDHEYQSSYTKKVPKWLFYNKMKERQLSDLGSNVIIHRLDDYMIQYKFLFETNSQIALNIAAIRIVDETSFFDAIINFIVKRLKDVDSLEQINPINIYFDKLGVQINSLFKELYDVTTMTQLNDLLKTPYKGSKFEDYEVLELLQKQINVYKIPENKTMKEMDLFFHVTFYQFMQRKGLSVAKMDKLGKNYALGGLLSSPQYNKEANSYANGFGLGEIIEHNRTPLVNFMIKWNSFIASTNKDTDIFRSGDTLINNIPELNRDEITPILKHSSWVTLLNLDVDLSYFFDESNGEMLVIHYTDQSTMAQYESVTVTNDIKQYDRLLKETLLEDLSDRKVFDTKEVIKNFNVINGQWLLKLISDKTKKRINSNALREKLSIISSYKEMLGILDHPDFYWVPISLEEILRVSGMVGLSMKEGLFSSKNLGHTGVTSDDLLFMGIDLRGTRIKLHFLPIEVKVGINNQSVTDKAFKQLKHTADILKKYLGKDNEDKFMREYYRNFFVSIMLGNLEKMLSSNIFTRRAIPNYKEIKNKLVIGEYDISYELEEYYGQGIVFEFSKDQTVRRANLITSRNTMLIKVPESDAYNVVADKTVDVVSKIQQEIFDFRKEVLLNHNLSMNNVISEDIIFEKEVILDRVDELEMSNIHEIFTSEEPRTNYIDLVNDEIEEMISDNIKVEPDETDIIQTNIVDEIKASPTLSDTRLYFGDTVDSGSHLYWEFGHSKLANRHLFITGKSGQGKTYFVQTLLSELSNHNIDALVIDYTDGFLPNQLDSHFNNRYNDKIKNRFILQDKLPINPFKRQEIDLGGFVIPESEQDMVDRVVQVIDFVFDLGIQQRTLLSESILSGYRSNGDNYKFSHLAADLKYSEDKAQQNLYGRISALLTRDPFSYDNDFDWTNIYGNTGQINIFQLKGFQLNIQKVLIEFLLWDLYQFATRVGNEGKPLPLVLDEVQNLNFNASSPAVKILREGRKFGMSGIFATQSLDSIKGNDAEAIYNAAEQLHFLPPESQVTAIARSMTSDMTDRKEVETTLKMLLKGEAIAYGPVKKQNGDLSEPKINQVKIASFEQRNR